MDGEALVGVGMLVDEGDASGAFSASQCREILAGVVDAPVGGGFEVRDEVKQCGFPCAVGADERGDSPWGCGEGDVVDDGVCSAAELTPSTDNGAVIGFVFVLEGEGQRRRVRRGSR